MEDIQPRGVFERIKNRKSPKGGIEKMPPDTPHFLLN
jgi:hypothetical protein